MPYGDRNSLSSSMYRSACRNLSAATMERSLRSLFRRAHARDVRREIAPVFEEPVQPALEIGQPIEELGFKSLHCKQRNEADHGAHFHRLAFAVRKMQN